jgi:hypothetical protein
LVRELNQAARFSYLLMITLQHEALTAITSETDKTFENIRMQQICIVTAIYIISR